MNNTSCASGYSDLYTDAGNGTTYTTVTLTKQVAGGGGSFFGNSTFFTNATNALKNGNRSVGVGSKSNLENSLAYFYFTSTPRFAFRYPSVTISNSVGGTTTPASGFYAVTNPAQIQANASIGYHFKAWTNGSTTNPINLIVANQDVTIGAIFEADIFRISGAKSLTIPPSGSATYYYVPYVNDVDPSIYGYNVSLTYQKNPSNCTGDVTIYANPTKGSITVAYLQPPPNGGYWGTPAGQITWTATFTKPGVAGSRTATWTVSTPKIGNPFPILEE